MPHADLEEKKAYAKAYYQRRKEELKAAAKENYLLNKQVKINNAKKWKAANPERMKEIRAKERQRPEIKAAVNEACKRRRNQKQAIHLTGGEKLFVQSYYLQAQELAASTGIPHEVDHIIPLCQGGLHAPWNLQVLTQFDNRSKGGR
jgi:5-methylcytosine-specific restriction endonuclease McrA